MVWRRSAWHCFFQFYFFYPLKSHLKEKKKKKKNWKIEKTWPELNVTFFSRSSGALYPHTHTHTLMNLKPWTTNHELSRALPVICTVSTTKEELFYGDRPMQCTLHTAHCTLHTTHYTLVRGREAFLSFLSASVNQKRQFFRTKRYWQRFEISKFVYLNLI